MSTPSSSSSSAGKDIHLLVVCHGLWGSVSHVENLSNKVSEVHARRASNSDDAELRVLIPKTNESDLTYDGIDLCAHRAVAEIDAFIAALSEQRIVRFSIVGYSLGGLIARYVVGVLESRTPSFFDNIEPANFATFASPAIGIPVYPSFVSRATNYLGARLLSNTGQQLYAADDYLNGKSLLEVMAQPGTSFHTGLTRFKKKAIFANTVNDRTVPFATGGFPESHTDIYARADRIARLYAKDPGALYVDLADGGLVLTFEDDCPYIIRDAQQKGQASQGEESGGVINPDAAQPPAHPKQSRIPSLPFFLRPSTFSAVPYRLGYVVPFLMPVLLPSFVVYIGSRFLLSSRTSQKRIRAMYTGELGTAHDRLRSVGLAIEDTYDELAGDALGAAASEPGSAVAQRTAEDTDAILTHAQRRMADNLNAVPGLEKHLVYLPHSRNSHGAIVARDLRWDGNEKGLEIIGWWAERIVL